MDYRALRRAAQAQLILRQRQEELDRARGVDTQLTEEEERAQAAKVRAATSSHYTWLTKYTKTFNPHWKEEGRPSAHEPFPDWPFMQPTLEYIHRPDEKVKRVEKSRTMMLTWTLVGYFTLEAMMVPERQVVFQTMSDEKVWQMVDYAKCLWDSQPEFLKKAFPLSGKLEKFARNTLEFKNGSVIFGVAGGKGKMRSYHPWGYLNDETAFQPEAQECYDEALPACQKIVLNSTAEISWFFESNNDAEIRVD